METEYYYSSSKSGFVEFARELTKVTGTRVEIVDNRLNLPPEFAEGVIAFYELTDGLAIGFADCVLHKKLKVGLEGIAGGDNYRVLFNVNNALLPMTNSAGTETFRGGNLAEAVFFSSASIGSELLIGKGQSVKLVQLHFNGRWFINTLLQNKMPQESKRFRQFINYEPCQFVTPMDLRSHELLNEIFEIRASGRLLIRILEGYADRLMALFLNNIIEDELGASQNSSNEAVRIFELKKNIEENLERELPSVDEAAAMCLMSRTRFIEMFKKIFQKNYGSFFLDLKMQKAKTFLAQQFSVAEVGYKTGYVNTSHFIKSFKTYFGITPGSYQNNLTLNGNETAR